MVMMAGLDCHDASPFGYLDAMETQSAHAALIEINIAAIARTPRFLNRCRGMSAAGGS
jgi:hypothetical protein